MTGNLLIERLRARLDDEGDDTQLSNGTANPQYFYSNTELLRFLNMGQQNIYATLVDLQKRNELKGLVASTTAGTLPSAAYAPYAADINGNHATLIDSPVVGSKIFTALENVVTIVGTTIYYSGSGGYTIYYWTVPTDIAATGTTLTQMTTSFYTTLIDLAEYYATHKDAAQSRIIMRRKFGETNLPFVQLDEYLQNAT